MVPRSDLDDLYLWGEVRSLFEQLVGFRTDQISMHQFRELARGSYGNPNVIKADFDILYKNALRRAGPEQP